MTEVVSAGAGLYVLDRKVALCLAYQPSLRRELRVGDSVQVSPSSVFLLLSFFLWNVWAGTADLFLLLTNSGNSERMNTFIF